MAREADGVLRLAAVVRYEVELARRRRRAHLVDVVPVVDIDFQRAVLAGLELRGLGDDDPGKRAAALAACPGSLDALHVVDNDDVAVAFTAVADVITGRANDNGQDQSDTRRDGKEGFSTSSTRGSPYTKKHKRMT